MGSSWEQGHGLPLLMVPDWGLWHVYERRVQCQAQELHMGPVWGLGHVQ
jgi:hypothetical protein